MSTVLGVLGKILNSINGKHEGLYIDWVLVAGLAAMLLPFFGWFTKLLVAVILVGNSIRINSQRS